MALSRSRRSDSGFNYWPGFVDALSTLVLAIVFLLSVFLVVQFFLSQEVTGKDKALERLNAQIAQLNDLLSLEKLGKLNLDDQLSQMRAGLASAEAERDRVKGSMTASRVPVRARRAAPPNSARRWIPKNRFPPAPWRRSKSSTSRSAPYAASLPR
jgi:hypothetical protein